MVYADTQITEFGDALYLFAANRVNDRLSFSPLWSGVVSAAYQVPLSSSLALRLSAGRSTARPTTRAPIWTRLRFKVAMGP